MSAGERLEEIAAEIRAHRGCGFEPCETATHPVPGEGSPDAELFLVGEAPGRQEDRQGRPFVGAAGMVLEALLASIGLARQEVFITNVLKSRPPGNRDPKPDEVFHSWPWLAAQLAAVDPRVVVPLGRWALHCLIPGQRISQAHGRTIEHEGRLYFPLYHPAASLRIRPLLDLSLEDIGRLPAVLAGSPAH
ncbi:MAG: uracil-DNA glycosylase [Solirubrobacteraceae bacterium]